MGLISESPGAYRVVRGHDPKRVSWCDVVKSEEVGIHASDCSVKETLCLFLS